MNKIQYIQQIFLVFNFCDDIVLKRSRLLLVFGLVLWLTTEQISSRSIPDVGGVLYGVLIACELLCLVFRDCIEGTQWKEVSYCGYTRVKNIV